MEATEEYTHNSLGAYVSHFHELQALFSSTFREEISHINQMTVTYSKNSSILMSSTFMQPNSNIFLIVQNTVHT
jgi:hypothetical protein